MLTISQMEHQQDNLSALPETVTRRLGAVLSWAAQSAQEMADRALEPLGLTVRHFGVLTFLRGVEREAQRGGGSLSQQAIGERLRIDRTTMVALIDEFEERGYVERKRNPDDRRAYVITLTSAGRRAQARAEKAVDAHAVEFFGRLSQAEREELRRLLARLVERAE
jgi:MarR family transcriptional regulator, lower aerobic nicotinate degradation pathway regulator